MEGSSLPITYPKTKEFMVDQGHLFEFMLSHHLTVILAHYRLGKARGCTGTPGAHLYGSEGRWCRAGERPVPD